MGIYETGTSQCPQPCESGCYDPKVGDKCDATVRWVIDEGVNLHPDWYPGLSPTSSYRDAQLYFHQKTGECPKPCPKRANITEAYANIPFKLCFDHENANDACERMVRQALSDPSMYGTSSEGSFREIQRELARKFNGTCSEPCDECARANKGSSCEAEIYNVIKRLLGVLQHPYSASFPWTSFDEFQSTLHRFGKAQCPQPCAAVRLPASALQDSRQALDTLCPRANTYGMAETSF